MWYNEYEELLRKGFCMEEKNKNKAIKKSSKKLKRVMIVTTI